MKARIAESQSDLFEVGVLSQTADVQSMALDQLATDPSGPPVVIVGGILAAERLGELRRLFSTLARARTTVIVVPPYADLDIGRYFETPVQLRVQRRAAESAAQVVDESVENAVGAEVKVRSDHVLETALGAGVVAVDGQGKPVLIRYQAFNTAGPVFFSTLQLLTYTALTDEGQRQSLLAELLSWTPAVSGESSQLPRRSSRPPKPATVNDGVLVPVALLLAAAAPQTEEQLRARADSLLGADLTADDVRGAVEELGRRGLIAPETRELADRGAVERFLEERGMHPYLRELATLLAAEEAST